MSACSDPQMNELLGAYLLGACANDEADAVRDHIASCPVCASEVAELVLARDALLNVTPTRAAPPQLKERVMAQVRADAELFAAAGGRRADAPHVPATAKPARRESRLRSWLRSPASLAAAAACALVLIVGGALIGSSIGGDEGAGGSRTVLGKVKAAPGGSAKLVIDDAGTAHLVVSGLPDPGRRRVYQVWLQTGKGAPVPTQVAVLGDGGRQRRGGRPGRPRGRRPGDGHLGARRRLDGADARAGRRGLGLAPRISSATGPRASSRSPRTRRPCGAARSTTASRDRP